MAAPWEPWLTRWQNAELLDEPAVRRIREYEAAAPSEQGFRWPILLALACGAILLAAGIMLFVSAHWDSLSPSARMTVVVGSLATIHLAGAWFADRFLRCRPLFTQWERLPAARAYSSPRRYSTSKGTGRMASCFGWREPPPDGGCCAIGPIGRCWHCWRRAGYQGNCLEAGIAAGLPTFFCS